jgi:hypothetical protein
MVRFFNQKEEVIKIELTPYGKQRFATGSFSPHYYSFYDNSILYDGTYGGISENQNNIVERITNSTPRLRPISRLTSSLNPVVSLSTYNRQDEYAASHDWTVPFFRTLGQSSPWVQFTPSWDIRVVNLSDAQLNTGVYYQAGEVIPMMSATLNIEYTTTPLQGDEGEEDKQIYIQDKSETLVLDVQELNTIYKAGGNFDIEILMSGSNNGLTSLGFVNPAGRHSDRLGLQTDAYTLINVLQGTQQEVNRAFPVLDGSYVEYFLDISVDKEIGLAGMPEKSSLYKRSTRVPIDLCAIRDNIDDGNDGTL